jgi:hypothetical protein
LKGLIDVNFVDVTLTTSDATVTAEFNYGTALNKLKLKGALVADFSVYNNTTAASVGLASSLEGPDGTYVLSFASGQNVGDSLTISVNKTGFTGSVTATI